MITTLTGTNGFLLRAKLRQMTDAFIAQYGNFGMERFPAGEADYEKLLDSVQALPFLAERRMVIIDTPSDNKKLAEHIENFLDGVSDTTDLVLVEAKFDKRSQLYKVLKKQTDLHDFVQLDSAQLPQWVAGQVQEQGGEITAAAARYLIDRVGSDQLRLSNEIAKLVVYSSKVTSESIDLLTAPAPQSTIFELLDAAFAGNQKRVLQLYDEQRQQKVEPQAILALLVWQLHILAVVKAAADTPPAKIAEEAKLNPFVVRKTAALASRMTLSQLKQVVHRVLEVDMQLKQRPINADQAIQTLLLTIQE